ncbi:MAG TPA: NAD-glutamate dehydrogenase [Xanthobacteraceae bacterium]|jgi:glutamate dehydrogenase|nr:NAD-glutamate dehydrogenase [Xanthobacteraceae bacterium]
MNVQDIPRHAGDYPNVALVEAATALLAKRNGKIPDDFFAKFFGLATPEDLARYTAEELAAIAEQSWLFLAERQAGTAKLRFDPVASQRGLAVLEMINDDMPFLVDSVVGELQRRALDIRLFVHPRFVVERDLSGRLVNFKAPRTVGGVRESVIHVHVAGMEDAAQRAEILHEIDGILGDVRVAVQDWQAMLGRVNSIITDLRSNPPPLPVEEIAETVQFLEWMADDHFTLLGARDYSFIDSTDTLEPVNETGLGLLRSPDFRLLRRGRQLVTITPELVEFLKEPKLLIVTKAAVRSRVHRRTHLDYIGVKRFDRNGKLVGECRFCGLFTSTAYTQPSHVIPYLRRKLDAVIRRAGFEPSSHSGKALVNVLETYPRDDLFQVDEETLYQSALVIQQLEERPRVRVLPRRDRFDRFVSLLVYIPRDRYDGDIRAAIGDYLATVYKGRISAYYPFFAEGPLVRVHFIVARYEGETPNPPRAELEHAIEEIIRSWTDGLRAALTGSPDPQRERQLFTRYSDAFPIDYREVYQPATALEDIGIIEALTLERPLGVDLYRAAGGGAQSAGLKVFSLDRPIPLSERVPVLENMGFRVVDERTYDIKPKGGTSVWFHDMTLQSALGEDFGVTALKERVQACFLVVMSQKAESDGYNALVLATNLGWRDVALVRTISRFLRQIRVPYSQDYMWTTLRKYPAITAQIVSLFAARFDPHTSISADARAANETTIVGAIETALAAVESLDEDRILRHFVNAVTSAIRTNFYQLGPDGHVRDQIAIKFSSRKVDGMPLPRPLYEIFVYSPRVEGVHLRFGKVARGGIRWSDRPQDFRTEVLGLVKAQNVKNAVIVPVGAKGGFVPKRMPSGGSREAIQAEGVATYKTFISTLLDITDNIGPGTAGVIPPVDVVRHEGDDPYLVVAADKGTATFSDIANELAIAHDFWLGDAFASGGSAGYDHKKMGITARGAWESVKRHFREMDVDIGTTPFTAIGVGDMSGDVFGNGMLRETTTKLVAAFDHRDIFIDPNPDPERAFAERKRMFDLPRSSWQDFDKSIISKGGGIYSRKAKSVEPSPEAQKLFGVGPQVTPQEFIRAILKSQVDLLFFGGIGTYIRASEETEEAAGDRANDPIRITGKELRCKVIGEGANLGMTQRGRIEAATHGVRLNTDAIDNSAGVNTSDMEVNIKIALSIPLRDGRLAMAARNTFLASMTDEVAALVLRNNYLQTLALSLSQRRGIEDFGFLQRLIQILESRGLLDRAVEFLPDDIALAERRRRSELFTRPELSVLLAYAKLTLYDDLLETTVPDDPYLARELSRYFPKAIPQHYPDALEKHRLRREIITTHLANSMINRGGLSLIVRIADQTGATPAGIASAFAVVRDSYGMTALNTEIDALDNKVPGKLQLELYAAVQDLLLDRIVWFLRNVDLTKGLADLVTHYRDGIAAVTAALDDALSPDMRNAREARQQELKSAGVPDALAARLANLRPLTSAPDIVQVAERTSKPVAEVTATYFAAGAFFRLDRIASAASAIPIVDYFDRLALDRARDSIGDAERRLTAAMVGNGTAGTGAVDAWIATRKDEVERIRASIHEIANSGLTLSKLSVAASLLGDLVKN